MLYTGYHPFTAMHQRPVYNTPVTAHWNPVTGTYVDPLGHHYDQNGTHLATPLGALLHAMRPQPGYLPPAQPAPAPRPAPGGLYVGPNQPAQPFPSPMDRPAPGGLNQGPNQPAQPVPGVIAPDPYGGGGSLPPRGLQHIIAGMR